jgi:hypothetical protein
MLYDPAPENEAPAHCPLSPEPPSVVDWLVNALRPTSYCTCLVSLSYAAAV